MLNSLGTAEAIFLPLERPLTDPQVGHQGYTQGAHVAGQYYVFGGQYTSGASVEWLREVLGGVDYDTLIAEARRSHPGRWAPSSCPTCAWRTRPTTTPRRGERSSASARTSSAGHSSGPCWKGWPTTRETRSNHSSPTPGSTGCGPSTPSAGDPEPSADAHQSHRVGPEDHRVRRGGGDQPGGRHPGRGRRGRLPRRSLGPRGVTLRRRARRARPGGGLLLRRRLPKGVRQDLPQASAACTTRSRTSTVGT